MFRGHDDTCHYVDLYPDDNGVLGLSEREQAVIENINQKIAEHSSLSEIIDFVFKAMEPIRSSDRFSLAFLDESGRRIVSHHVAANYEPILLAMGWADDLTGSSLKEVLEGSRARIIDDLEAYLLAHRYSRSTKLILQEGIRSSMTCPVVVRGKAVGVAFWSSKKPNAYHADEVTRHRAIAQRLGQAVGTAQVIEHLRKANEAYMDLLGFVSHELKNPVASLLTTTNLFLHGYLGELTAAQKEKLRSIKSKGEYLLDIVDQYLGLARVEGGAINPRFAPVEDLVTDVVEPAVEMASGEMERQEARLERQFPEAPIEATCDPDLLKIVLTNFLSNAFKYGNKGGLTRISASLDAEGLHVSVWNEGPGFPSEERNLLFRRFSRLQTAELVRRKGTGVGLYICWRMVNAHGGKVRAESKPGEWAEFSIHIPQPPVASDGEVANAYHL